MKSILSLLLFCAMAVNSAAQLTKTSKAPALRKFESAVAYNDFMVKEQTGIGEKIKTFIDVFSNSKDSTAIQAARETIVSQSDSAIAHLKQAEPYEGDTSLKKNALNLFAFYSRMAANEYNQFVLISLDKNRSSEDKKKDLNTIISSITEAEKIYDSNFSRAQQAFAAKYNIKLKENEFKIGQ